METHGNEQKLDEGESNFARSHLLNLFKCDYAGEFSQSKVSPRWSHDNESEEQGTKSVGGEQMAL